MAAIQAQACCLDMSDDSKSKKVSVFVFFSVDMPSCFSMSGSNVQSEVFLQILTSCKCVISNVPAAPIRRALGALQKQCFSVLYQTENPNNVFLMFVGFGDCVFLFTWNGSLV